MENPVPIEYPKERQRRFVVVSPDLEHAQGFDNRPGADAAALAFGDGAHVVDTYSGPYQPALSVAQGGEMRILGAGSFNRKLGHDGNLLEAAMRGIAPAVRAFLWKGADANAADGGGGTALIWAAAKGDAGTVKVLLAHGADPALADGDGMTPLQIADRKRRADVVQLLKAALKPFA